MNAQIKIVVSLIRIETARKLLDAERRRMHHLVKDKNDEPDFTIDQAVDELDSATAYADFAIGKLKEALKELTKKQK